MKEGSGGKTLPTRDVQDPRAGHGRQQTEQARHRGLMGATTSAQVVLQAASRPVKDQRGLLLA